MTLAMFVPSMNINMLIAAGKRHFARTEKQQWLWPVYLSIQTQKTAKLLKNLEKNVWWILIIIAFIWVEKLISNILT